MSKLGDGRFRGFSAGSQPVGQVNPFALELLEEEGFDTSGLSSKSWDVFSAPGADAMYFVFTVCGSAAAETCPVWPGHPATAHWGLEDPAGVEGGSEAKRAAFRHAYAILKRRIQAFVAMDVESCDEASLRARLDEIGKL